MAKTLGILLLILLAGCSSSSKNNQVDSSSTKARDSIAKQKKIDTQMAKGERPAEEEEAPSLEVERQRIANNYDKVQVFDTVFVNDTDSLYLHVKYYCLKSSKLVIPNRYESDEKSPMDFITHQFASDITLVNKRDTVLNKQFKASNFTPFYNDPFGGNLKKYGSIIDMPKVYNQKKDKNNISLCYSLAIPTTDLGISMFLIIYKNGRYKMVENINM